MKQILKLFLPFILLTTVVNAQDNWYWQNPLPQGNDIMDVFIFDQNSAIAVGANGSILKSTNGGNSWDFQSNAAGIYRRS